MIRVRLGGAGGVGVGSLPEQGPGTLADSEKSLKNSSKRSKRKHGGMNALPAGCAGGWGGRMTSVEVTAAV